MAEASWPMPPFHVFRGFLGGELRLALLDWVLGREADFEPARVIGAHGAVVDPARRIASRLPDLGPWQAEFTARLRSSAPEMMARVGHRPFEVAGVELELAAHGHGAHFSPHVDLPTGALSAKAGQAGRALSGVYYFHAEPKAFSGGALRLHRFGGRGGEGDWADITPEQDSFLVFPSWARHEVRRVSCPSRRFRDFRFAVNCWLHRA